jgi:WD40 repeat protein
MNTIGGHHAEWSLRLLALGQAHLAVCYDHSFGRNIRILNWETSGEYGLLTHGHTDDVTALTKLEDDYLASGSLDKTIRIWHWRKVRLVANITTPTKIGGLISIKNFSQFVSFSDSNSDDFSIKVWNRSNGNLTKTLAGHLKFVASTLALENGHLASGSRDLTIRIWNLTLAQTIRILTGHSANVYSMTNIGASRLASGDQDGIIKVWSIDSDNAEQMHRTLLGHSKTVTSLVQIFNGHLVSSCADSTFRIWDLNQTDDDESLIKTTYAHSDGLISLILIPNGNLASNSYDGTIKIWHFDNLSTIYQSRQIFL